MEPGASQLHESPVQQFRDSPLSSPPEHTVIGVPTTSSTPSYTDLVANLEPNINQITAMPLAVSSESATAELYPDIDITSEIDITLEIDITPEIAAPTFTLFEKLPSELHLKIWREASESPEEAQAPKTVQVTLTKPTPDSPRPKFKMLTPVPALRHVCSESRSVALEGFQPAFVTKCGRDGKEEAAREGDVYVHPYLDTIVLIIPDWIRQFNQWSRFGKNPAGVTKTTATATTATKSFWGDSTHYFSLFELYPDVEADGKRGIIVWPKSIPRFGTQEGDLEPFCLPLTGGALKVPCLFPDSWDGFWDDLCDHIEEEQRLDLDLPKPGRYDFLFARA
ncbi:uncharacterized protein L3040_000150 [Drepanopeziza brunnea f. sp. 'multigermtubi']|uniref:uncharacterized protein n=1 Tax=Drepanopeziza brunnea f. sp. 'multigermtubi' TaxID=698441 RepID=UPI002399313F|nr:hypothetical protein L3040_000150 [Drepanopeziza brunnea f. sp. 'multigermtubi']